MIYGMKGDVAFQLGDMPAVEQDVAPLLEIGQECPLIEDPVRRHRRTEIIQAPELFPFAEGNFIQQ